MKKCILIVYTVVFLPLPGWAETFNKVEDEVGVRTGAVLRWEKDSGARKESETIVAALLRKPLTVASAVQIGLLNNRELQATFEEVGIAYADLLEALTVPNPSIDFDVEFPTSGPGQKYEWLVAQEFVQLIMIPLKRRIAIEQLEAAQLRVAAEVLSLIAKVKTAYFTVQADQQLLSRLKTIQETNGASLDLVQKQFEAGNIPDLELLRMQATYNDGRIDIANAQKELNSHREKLTRLLGLWGQQTDWKIVQEISPIPASDFSYKNLESLAVANRLDLRAANRQLTSLVSALGLTKKFRWLGALEFGFAGEKDPGEPALLGPSIRFEVPIFNQGQAKIAKGESELRKAQLQFEALAIEIRSEVREFRDELITLADLAKFYRDEALPLRIKLVNKTLLYYNAMQVGPVDLFSAKAEELKTERAYIETLRDYWITRAELERTVGGSLTPRPTSVEKSVVQTTKKKSHE